MVQVCSTFIYDPFYYQILTYIRTWVGNSIKSFIWHVITHPYGDEWLCGNGSR